MARYGIVFALFAGAALAAPPADLTLKPVASGFSRPLAVRHAGDGSGRLFVVEQAGKIRIIGANGQVLATPFLDIVNAVDDGSNEQGLLGLAFDPDYPNNGLFYVNYTWDPPGGGNKDRTRVSRFSVSAGNANLADAGSETVLIEIEQDFGNHNGGDIHFGPDGYLYVGMGDGGSGGDPNNRAQTLDNLLGKMLRLDVHPTSVHPAVSSCSDGPTGYGVPADNPFVGNPAACDEIWAYGLRNPWRWSFDRLTGDMLIGDVGQDAIEEIDFQSAASRGGENYGWSCKEGKSTVNYNPCLPGPLKDPILQYNHGLGCSVSGGYRYRGAVPGMKGIYIYADYCSGRIWFATFSTLTWTTSLWQDSPHNVSAFGEDESGEIYLVDLNGTVYRFESPNFIAGDDFEAGGFNIP